MMEEIFDIASDLFFSPSFWGRVAREADKEKAKQLALQLVNALPMDDETNATILLALHGVTKAVIMEMVKQIAKEEKE